MKQSDIAVVLPVYDDWKSFGILVHVILEELCERVGTICIVKVNDSSLPVSLDKYSVRDLVPGSVS